MLDQLSLLSFASGGWGSALLAGSLVTIALALSCLPIGLPLGLVVAVAARSKNRWMRAWATTFSTVFRGLPELLTLLIIYYGCQIAAQKILALMGFDVQFTINTFVAAMIAFSLVFAAFSSEIWLGAFKTIPKGQFEAASALGLSKFTTFRKVVLPQLARIALPGLSNNWLSLLKDTSLVSTSRPSPPERQPKLGSHTPAACKACCRSDSVTCSSLISRDCISVLLNTYSTAPS